MLENIALKHKTLVELTYQKLIRQKSGLANLIPCLSTLHFIQYTKRLHSYIYDTSSITHFVKSISYARGMFHGIMKMHDFGD